MRRLGRALRDDGGAVLGGEQRERVPRGDLLRSDGAELVELVMPVLMSVTTTSPATLGLPSDVRTLTLLCVEVIASAYSGRAENARQVMPCPC